MTLKIKDDEKKIANDLLKAYRAGEQKGLTIAKEDLNKPLSKEELKKLQDKQDKSSPYEPFKSPFKKAQKQQIKPNTILLPKTPKGEVKDPNSEFYKDNIYGLQAHGTHVNEPIQPINDQHRWREHVGIDPGGKDMTYQDVPLFNKDGKPLGITRNNEGMVRKEYWELMGQPWVLYGFPPGKEGETQYKKLLKEQPDLFSSRNNDLQISDASHLTDVLSPHQDPRSGSLRGSGLSDQEKKDLLIRGRNAYQLPFRSA